MVKKTFKIVLTNTDTNKQIIVVNRAGVISTAAFGLFSGSSSWNKLSDSSDLSFLTNKASKCLPISNVGKVKSEAMRMDMMSGIRKMQWSQCDYFR